MTQTTGQPINLPILPKFSDVKDFADIQARLISSARELMLEYYLEIRNNEFSITALELYLKLHNQKTVWWDASTDRDEDADEQFNSGTWYVRRKKGQRYWRIDITAGDISERIQAGILIRQLDGLGGHTPGPATALHRIVRGEFLSKPFDQEQLELLDRIHGRQIDGSDGSPLRLRRRPSPIMQSLAKGTRFNLPPKLDPSIRDAALRISFWRKYSADTVIAVDSAEGS